MRPQPQSPPDSGKAAWRARALTLALILAALMVLTVVIGCSATTPPPSSPGLPKASGADWLADVCPRSITIQEAWEPQADMGGRFRLLGPGYHIDAARKRVSGPLIIRGVDTGVRLELRSGGPAIGFHSVAAQLYLDRSAVLGSVPTDLAIAASSTAPVVAVFAPITKSPLILMWDPASHPDWHTITDIGASSARVVMGANNSAGAFLTARGVIKPSQLDTSYTGGPARFLADPTIAQQGFVTNEPYLYAHEITAWAKPVRYQLLADVGYQSYPDPLSVRSGDLPGLGPCLQKLVPVLQRGQRDYLSDPHPVNELITQVRVAFDGPGTYSLAVADYASAVMTRAGLVADDQSGPLGGLDTTRIQTTIDTMAPILSAGGTQVRPGLRAGDLATNTFLDPRITPR